MGGPLRLLLFEDSEADAALLLHTLARQGYDVRHRRIETADQLRAAVEEQVWDAAISDYSMPNLSIEDVLAVFRERGVDVPFIVVSGTIGEEMAVSAMKSGAHDFFLKGHLARLGSAIERELREADVRRERRAALQGLKDREGQLEEAVRVRDEFIAIASHELRTPLTPLLLELGSALDSLRRCAKTEPALQKLEAKLGNCLRHTERLTSLISNMLNVTQIVEGGLQADPTQLDLREVAGAVVERMRQSIATSRSEVRLRALEPVLGIWDRRGIETIVVNLLTNALKFGRKRPIEIAVERSGDIARLTIADQGIGIAPEEQARIFDRFERAVPSQHYGGFGIGLWIARQVAEAHGGVIRVASTQGIGSTFVVELPALPPTPRHDTMPYRVGSSPSQTLAAITGLPRDIP